jgi:hypothetical protein
MVDCDFSLVVAVTNNAAPLVAGKQIGVAKLKADGSLITRRAC